MPVTTIHIANIGSPPDDPLCPLDAVLYVPPAEFSGPFHCFVATEAPGFQHSPGLQAPGAVLMALAEVGILGLVFRCRVDSEFIVGQTTDGKWHQQTDDCKIGIRYMRPGGKIETIHGFQVTGFVGMTGGSAAAHHAVYCALDGTPGDDKVECALGFSPPTDFSDVSTQAITGGFHTLVEAYGRGDGSGDPADLALLRSRSPIALDLANANPIRQYNGTAESMPYAQLTNFRDAMIAAGAVGHVAITNSLPGEKNKHSWDIWRGVANVQPDSIAWVLEQIAAFEGGGGGGGMGPKMWRGAASGTTAGKPINQAILDNKKVDGIGLNTEWFDLEPTDGVYDFSYFDTEIKRAAAASKHITLRIASMGGSKHFGGNTPNWIFDAIGNTPEGNPGSITDGVTNGTPTILSVKANFTNSGDLHSAITGTDIPANTYLGTILSPTTALLSSSPTSQVNVSATGSHSSCAWTIANRPRVGSDRSDTVWGQTYTYLDPSETHQGPPETTIPVYWQALYRNRKARMLNYLGNHITNGTTLTPSEKAAVATVGISYANAQTEDWNVPGDDTVDDIPPGNTLTRLEKWLNPTDLDDVTQRGAGYTTQRMIDNAVKRADEHFTDGQTFTNKRLVSLTATFAFADIGKTVVADSGHQVTIASWVSHTEVLLDEDTLTTGTAGFTIKNRDTGYFDIAIAAFPNQFCTTAIGSSRTMDKAAADLAGDSDFENYLARTVQGIVNAKYPQRIITQKNNFAAHTPHAPGKANSSQALLWEISQSGHYVAAQDLWNCFGDPTFRMNGHQPGDIEEISESAALSEFSYGCQYREMYATDCINMPLAVIFTHDLFVGDDVEPPPPPPPPDEVPPPSVTISSVDPNFRDGVYNEVAALLNIDLSKGILPARSQRWIISINRHLRYAWRIYWWPELLLTEERAFRSIWNDTDTFREADEVFYVTDQTYYRAIGAPTPSTPPPDEPTLWDTFTLLSRDYFIPTLQRCRWEIGDVQGVFPGNPNVGPLNYSPLSLDWRRSNRGIEVFGSSAGKTVFIRHRIVPPRYTATAWATGSAYKAGDLVLWDSTGEVYRAIIDVAGIAPSNSARWAFVPFPIYFANYCIYMAAADDSDDIASANEFRQLARDFLTDEIDKYYIQDTIPTYNFGRAQRFSLPAGTSGFIWSAVPPFTETSSPVENAISTTCTDKWGSVIPTS